MTITEYMNDMLKNYKRFENDRKELKKTIIISALSIIIYKIVKGVIK